MRDLREVKSTCLNCTRCNLSEKRNHVVFGVGPEHAEIMFVGEGPGQQEDLTGEPFVGPAGQLLDDMLIIIDLGRDNCYIANTVKCRPTNNRDPKPEELTACRAWLDEQIAIIHPKMIVCLGRISAKELISPDFQITKEHGKWTFRNGIWFTATYHPSALLRDPSKRPEAFSDLKIIQSKAKEICTSTF